MAAKLSQSLKQQQSLLMTPQLQQAIKLLTLTHMEMTSLISQEMTENPLLEEGGTEISQAEHEYEKTVFQEKTAEEFDGPKVVEGKDDFDWAKYAESYSNTSSTPYQGATGGSEEQFNYENIISREMSLTEHLEWQLRMETWTEAELKFFQHIIHNIDQDGYLDANIESLAQECELDLKRAEELLKTVQRLDPVGCGARSLEECLLVQAEELEDRSILVETLIEKYLGDIKEKNYDFLIKELAITPEALKNAEVIILSLNPKPGKLVGHDDTEYVVPDIYVKEIAGEFKVLLNDDGVPSLKISKLYQEMLKKVDDPKTQEFVQDKLRSALWLIKSIENRQKTIEKVACAIVKYQPEFFHKGATYLKPMILKDIAAEIEMHESTVSRVTTNKYMHTPLGVFELKYFFNVGIGGKNGGIDIAGEMLKVKIKQLIEAENPQKPLSDQKIVELLTIQDIKVARRTIAKYREMLDIPSSAKRKQKKNLRVS